VRQRTARRLYGVRNPELTPPTRLFAHRRFGEIDLRTSVTKKVGANPPTSPRRTKGGDNKTEGRGRVRGGRGGKEGGQNGLAPSTPLAAKPAAIFTPEKAASLSASGSKGVTKKRRKLHDKVVKERAAKLRRNSELRRKVEEGRRQREEMRRVRVERAREEARRERGAISIQRIWMGWKGRRKAKGVMKRMIDDLSKKVVRRLVERARKNAVRRVELARERVMVNENIKNSSAIKIQQYWAKKAAEGRSKGR